MVKNLLQCLCALVVLGIAICGAPRALAQGRFTPGDVYAGMIPWPPIENSALFVRVPAADEGSSATTTVAPLSGRTRGQIAWSQNLEFAYVALTDANKVVKITASGEVSDFAIITDPTGLIVLPDGTVLCASYFGNRVYDITAGGSAPHPVYAVIQRPLYLLRTSSGRILCGQNRGTFDDPAVVMDLTDPASPSVFATLPDSATALTELSDGRILCTVASQSVVLDITDGGTAGSEDVFASGRQFMGVTQNGAGNILATVLGMTGIWDISNGGSFGGVNPLYTTVNTGREALGTVPQGAGTRYELLYVTKDAVPNAGEDPRIQTNALWTNLGVPAVSESGKVAYLGKWKAPRGGELRSQTGAGVFLDDDLIVKAGDTVPGLNGAVFRSFRAPVVNADGRVAFIATIRGEGVTPETDSVVVSAGRTGSLEVIARKGEQAPGAGGATFRSFSSVSIQGEEVGGTIFLASLTRGSGSPVVDFTNNSGVWWQPVGENGTQLLVREGDPGFGTGEKISRFRVLRISGGSAGQGRGQISGSSALIQLGLSTGRQAQVLVTPQGFSPVAITGDVLGGTELPEAEWMRMGLPSSGASGTFISVLGTLKNNVGGVLSANAKGIFTSANAGDTWEPVAQTGTEAPGFDSAVFSVFKDPVNSSTGAGVAFIGTARGESVTPLTNSGIWWRPAGGALTLVARKGAQPPGAPEGAQWKGFTSLALPGGSAGPLFTATLQRGNGVEAGPGGITSIDDVALYSTNSSGKVSELLRENQVIESLERTVKKFNVLRTVSGSAGTTRAFNSNGEVLLQVTFKDRKIGILKISL